MLRFAYDHCDRFGQLTRRQWLGISSLAGLSCGTLHQPLLGNDAVKKTYPGFGRAKSVIVVFTSGGQSQIDMWDPKPLAPLDVRGEFQPIATSIPGDHFCEHLPRVAKIADRLTVVRSASHEDLDHGSAVYLTLTGHYHAQRSGNPQPGPNDAPTYGSLVRRLIPQNRFVSNAIHLNGPMVIPTIQSAGQFSGLLGPAWEPLVIGDVRSADGALPGLEVQAELPTVRMNQRLTLKQTLDHFSQQLDARHPASELSRDFRQALDLLSSEKARAAFDLNDEPTALRDRYGRHRSGQACLLARRLVEAGVPYINVIWNHSNRGQDLFPDEPDVYGWDTHNDIFGALKNQLLPRFDESFSALIEDLDQRGLLDETLVICLGEFGRAPRVALETKFKGSSPGRKHWATVYSVVMAGAGVSRGAIVGASDRLGAEPVTERIGPWDIAATMFSALGIDPSQHFTDTIGRKFLISAGTPIRDIYTGRG